MNPDLCALTDEMLPHYTEGVLPPATRRRIDEHAAECPACRERLERAAATLAPTERRPMPRRRPLIYSVVCLIVVLAAAGGWRYAASRRQPGPVETAATPIPAKVRSAEELATRAIPGWKRAEAARLVVDLGITQRIGDTDAAITLEKAWYNDWQIYILYTVKAPDGEYLLPAGFSIGADNGPERWAVGRSFPGRLSEWGGFSSDGFHGVMRLSRLGASSVADNMKLSMGEWDAVTPAAGVDQSRTVGSEMNLLLPFRSALRDEPAPVTVPWTRQQTWLGRTLAVEDLEVGIGHITLSGQITVDPGESQPVLDARLHAGSRSLVLESYNAIPSTTPGRYHFTAMFAGPDRWPAPVSLELKAIGSQTDATLEWPINWAKYRDVTRPEVMAPADQASVRVRDSALIIRSAWREGVDIEIRQAQGTPPYIHADLFEVSRGARPEASGFELVNERGEVFTAFDLNRKVLDPGQRAVIIINWGGGLPESFRLSNQLTLRYVQPLAVMDLNETWELK